MVSSPAMLPEMPPFKLVGGNQGALPKRGLPSSRGKMTLEPSVSCSPPTVGCPWEKLQTCSIIKAGHGNAQQRKHRRTEWLDDIDAGCAPDYCLPFGCLSLRLLWWYRTLRELSIRGCFCHPGRTCRYYWNLVVVGSGGFQVEA